MDNDNNYTSPLLASDFEDPRALLLGGVGDPTIVIDRNNHNEPESQFTKLISQVGNGIVPWGRYDNDDNDYIDDYIDIDVDDYQEQLNRQNNTQTNKNVSNSRPTKKYYPSTIIHNNNHNKVSLSNHELKKKHNYNYNHNYHHTHNHYPHHIMRGGSETKRTTTKWKSNNSSKNNKKPLLSSSLELDGTAVVTNKNETIWNHIISTTDLNNDHDDNNYIDDYDEYQSLLLFESIQQQQQKYNNNKQSNSCLIDHYIVHIDMNHIRNRKFIKCFIILSILFYIRIIYNSFLIGNDLLLSWTRTNINISTNVPLSSSTTTSNSVSSWYNDHDTTNTTNTTTANYSSSFTPYGTNMIHTTQRNMKSIIISKEYEVLMNASDPNWDIIDHNHHEYKSSSRMINDNNSSYNTYSNNSFSYILHNYNSSGQTIYWVLLIITSIIIPGVFIIVLPSWILYGYGIYYNNNNASNIVTIITSIDFSNRPRFVIQLFIRFSMIIVYIFLLLSIILNHIHLINVPSDTDYNNDIIINTLYQSGLIHYMSIIAYMSIICVMLRLPIPLCSNNSNNLLVKINSNDREIIITPKASNITDHHYHHHNNPENTKNNINDNNNNDENNIISSELNTSMNSTSSSNGPPPPHAFQIPWGIKEEKQQSDDMLLVTTNGNDENHTEIRRNNNDSNCHDIISSTTMKSSSIDTAINDEEFPIHNDDHENDIHMMPLEEQAASILPIQHNIKHKTPLEEQAASILPIGNNNNLSSYYDVYKVKQEQLKKKQPTKHEFRQNQMHDTEFHHAVEQAEPQQQAFIMNQAKASSNTINDQSSMSFYILLIIALIGFISVIFIVSLLFDFPLFELEYYGIASTYMNNNSNNDYEEKSHFVMNFYDLMQLLLFRGNYSSSYSYLNSTWICFIISCWIIIIPSISLLLCTTIWIIRGFYYFSNRISYKINNQCHDHCITTLHQCRNWLYAIHPICNGGEILCIATYITITSLELLISMVNNEHVKDQDLSSSSSIWWPFHNESMICHILTGATKESCLLVHGQFYIGGYIYLIQSILLEIWIYFTLQSN